MIDLQGTTIAVNDQVACCTKSEQTKDRVEFFVGTIAAITTDNGETYLRVTKATARKRYAEDYARVPCTSDGVCEYAVKHTTGSPA